MSLVRLVKNSLSYNTYLDVKPGSVVRLCFDDGMGTERLWVKVIAYSVRSNLFAGRIDSRPFYTDLNYGQAVIFSKEHVHSLWG